MKECGQQRCWCTVSKRDRERKKEKAACLPACNARLSVSLDFFLPALCAWGCVHSAICFKVVLNVTDVYSQRAVCFAFLHYSCMQKDCRTILNVAAKHAAQMMQMDFSNRVISSLTPYRGECLMACSDFFILVSCWVLLQLSYGLRDRSLDAQCLLPIEIEGKITLQQIGRFVCVWMRVCLHVCAMPP